MHASLTVGEYCKDTIILANIKRVFYYYVYTIFNQI